MPKRGRIKMLGQWLALGWWLVLCSTQWAH